jgi:hypothetical protein
MAMKKAKQSVEQGSTGWQSADYPRKAVPVVQGETDRDTGRNLAATFTGAEVAAYRVINAAERKSSTVDMLDVPTLLEQLRAEAKAVQEGSLAQAEAMLANQAVALQSLFARLVERGMAQQGIPAFEMNMRFALRAQSQCRATLETLAAIKQGPPVYARQANIATNQQINVGTAVPRAGEKTESTHPELLETSDGERLDVGATGTASRSNQDVAPVGKKHRPEDAGRQGALAAKRKSARNPCSVSRGGEGAARAPGDVEPPIPAVGERKSRTGPPDRTPAA